jgi:hypothetical protein
VPQPPKIADLQARHELFFFQWRFVPVALLVIAAFAVGWLSASGRGVVPDPNKWQSVFLNNGQVYFGHLQRTDGDYAEITNVYYLRAAQALQPPASSTPSPSFELVKLGGELHGPEDTMYFEKSSVLFWENMRNDSQVVQVINGFQGKTK